MRLPQCLGAITNPCINELPILCTPAATAPVPVQIDAAVEEGLPACGFLDVHEAVSVHLDTQTWHALVPMSEAIQSRVQQGCKLLAHRFLACPEFLDLCKEAACKAGAATAEHDLLQSNCPGTGSSPIRVGSAMTSAMTSALLLLLPVQQGQNQIGHKQDRR